MQSDKALRWSRRLAAVPRWQIVPTIKRQNVAEHSFHAAHIALWLTFFHRDNWDNAAIGRLMVEVLLHDVEEAAKGDTPSSNKGPKDYSKMEQFWILLKVADILEALAFLHEETLLGNRFLIADLFNERMGELEKVWAHFHRIENPGYKHPNGLLPPTTHYDLWQHFVLACFCSHPGMEN